LRELALHILDIAGNGITAGADCIHLRVYEERADNRLKIVVKDNGCGIPADMIDQVTDPFMTTRTTRRVGLGLSLFKVAAERCDGAFAIESQPGKGTQVKATFCYNHIDRTPVGDMAGSVTTLIAGNPGIDFVYEHSVDGKKFSLDTREIRGELVDLRLTDPAVIHHLTQVIRKALKTLTELKPTDKKNG
jgi:hypothetical protein